MSSDSVASIFGNKSTNFAAPKMFRVMRLYWRSQAKLGWLKRLLIIAIWPLIKPYIASKISTKLADALEVILEGI